MKKHILYGTDSLRLYLETVLFSKIQQTHANYGVCNRHASEARLKTAITIKHNKISNPKANTYIAKAN